MAGKSGSHHHYQSAGQRTERWLVWRENPFLTTTATQFGRGKPAGAYGDTGIMEVDYGEYISERPGVDRSHLII